MALTSIHTLFMREHNRLARDLKRLNPHWESETLYQEARKIMGAYTQVAYPESQSAFIILQSMCHTLHCLLLKINLSVPLRSLCSGTICHTLLATSRCVDGLVVTPATMPTLTPASPTSLQQQLTASPTWPSSQSYPAWMTTTGRAVSSPVSPCSRPSSRPGESSLRVSCAEGSVVTYHSALNCHPNFYFASPGGIDPLLRGLIGRPAKLNTQDHMMVDALRERLFQFVQHLALDLGSLNMARGRDHGLPGTSLTLIFSLLNSPHNVSSLS